MPNEVSLRPGAPTTDPRPTVETTEPRTPAAPSRGGTKATEGGAPASKTDEVDRRDTTPTPPVDPARVPAGLAGGLAPGGTTGAGLRQKAVSKADEAPAKADLSAQPKPSVKKLTDSPAVAKLPAGDRAKLIDRFATGGPEVQAQVDATLALVGKLTSHTPSLAASVTGAVIASITSGPAGEMKTRLASLDALTSAPGFDKITASEQRDLLTSLAQGGHSAERAGKLGELLKDASFLALPQPTRGELVGLIAKAPTPAGPSAKDDLDALVHLATNDAFAALAPAQQRVVLDTAATKPPGYMQKVLDLAASPGFKSAEPKVRDHLLALAKRPATRQADVANLDALTRAPGFDALKATPDAQNKLGDFALAHRDQAKAVNDMLAGAANAAPENRALFADTLMHVDPSKADQVAAFVALTTSADFKALGKDAQASVLKLAAKPEALPGLTKLVQSPAFKGQGAAGQKTLLAEMEKAGFGAAELTRFETLTADAGFTALAAGDQALVMLAMAKGKGTEKQRVALTGLVGHADFKALAADSKTAVLSQASNYPNPTAATNLTKMVQAAWFKSMPIADRQRTAKVIGYASTKLDGSTNATQKTIISNTLDRFLPPGTYTFEMANLNLSAVSVTFGENPAGTTTFRINRKLLDADNKKVEDGTQAGYAEHAALNTMCHEVNHAVNNVPMGETYDYFQDEYRAWYVGFVAENGRVPNRQEAYDRADYLLSATSGAYNLLRKARVEVGGDGKPSAESKKVIAFMSKFTGTALSSTDLASQGKAVNMKVGANTAAGEVELTNPTGAAPQPDPLLDMDN